MIFTVLFPVVMVKYPEQNNLREKEFIWLTIPGYSPSFQGSQGGEEGKNIEATSHITSTLKSCVNECLLMLRSLSLLLTEFSCLGNGATHNRPFQLIKEIPQRHAHRPT